MLIAGYDFWGDSAAMDYVPASVETFKKVELNYCVADELFISNDINYTMTTIPQDWDFNTILHAYFDNSLVAGNLNYTISQISGLRLKRREANTYQWTILAEFPVRTKEDLNISYVDRYANAGTTMEYDLVILTGDNIEGKSNIITVDSDFDGIVISEKDKGFRALIYDTATTERNHATAVVNTLSSKYPFIVRNSTANYTSGNINASFMPVDSCTITYDYIRDAKYREKLTNFLTNGRPKLLKLDDGRSWIVNIVDNVSLSSDPDMLYTNFNFVQSGDPLKNQDLYDADLVDVEPTIGQYKTASVLSYVLSRDNQ